MADGSHETAEDAAARLLREERQEYRFRRETQLYFYHWRKGTLTEFYEAVKDESAIHRVKASETGRLERS